MRCFLRQHDKTKKSSFLVGMTISRRCPSPDSSGNPDIVKCNRRYEIASFLAMTDWNELLRQFGFHPRVLEIAPEINLG